MPCSWCSRTFTPRQKGRKYCSRLCAARALVRRENQRCPTCRRWFEVGSRQKRFGRSIYCSPRCAHLIQTQLCARMKPTDRAYLAALVDGEGSIIFMKRPDGSIKSFRLQVTNTYVPVLEWCQVVTKLGSYQVKSKAGRQEAHHLACGAWAVYGVKAASVLKQILPYMQIKREKAVQALQVIQP